jgi:Putative auto-transporter adhesin, head GIN domain
LHLGIDQQSFFHYFRKLTMNISKQIKSTFLKATLGAALVMSAQIAAAQTSPTCQIIVAGVCYDNTRPSTSAQSIVGSGVLLTEVRQVPVFRELSVSSVVGAFVTVGTPDQFVQISGDDNIVPLIVTEVINDQLNISLKPGVFNVQPKQPLQATISVGELVSLKQSGASTASVIGLSGPNFFQTSLGSSTTNLAGQVNNLSFSLAGSSRVDARNLVAKTAIATTLGSSRLVVNASDSLNATALGTSSVRYLGKPTVTKSALGMATIAPLQ